jgi:16S rRNA (cytosine967-C5)-methyltransferase
LGTLRRNPDLKWRQSPKAVAEMQVRQKAILESAGKLLKPGGRLVYATCSLLPDENEAVVAAFEAQNPRFKPLAAAEVLGALKIPQSEGLCSADGRFLRLWPHKHATDGFFASVWQAT